MKRLCLVLGLLLWPCIAAAQQPVVLQCATGNPTNPWAACPTAGGVIPTATGTEYPVGAVPIQGSATGTSAAVTTTLAATANNYNFVCGISIRVNATAATNGNATLSDGTKTFNFTEWVAPVASGVGVVEEIFKPCYPAVATNTAWTLTTFAAGNGGVASASIWGYQKTTTP